MKTLPHLFVIAIVTLFLPLCASAHQPRIVDNGSVIITEPEISKVYYGTLSGAPQIFRISSEVPFPLYVNILVPDMPGQETDVSAIIYKDGSTTPYHTLLAIDATWTPMWEPFGNDHYLKGPEYKATVPAGVYEIQLTSSRTESRYSLAVGEIEHFDLMETANALHLVPRLKRDFFNESPIGFILSPMGIGYIVAMLLLSGVFGLLYRTTLRRFARSRASMGVRAQAKNIGTSDRVLRALFGLVLFLIAIMTTWSPLLLFAAGFCFFEALFSWCGFFAAIGKSTCPIE